MAGLAWPFSGFAYEAAPPPRADRGADPSDQKRPHLQIGRVQAPLDHETFDDVVAGEGRACFLKSRDHDPGDLASKGLSDRRHGTVRDGLEVDGRIEDAECRVYVIQLDHEAAHPRLAVLDQPSDLRPLAPQGADGVLVFHIEIIENSDGNPLGGRGVTGVGSRSSIQRLSTRSGNHSKPAKSSSRAPIIT